MIVGILFALPIEQHRFVSQLVEWERLETSGVRYDVGKIDETQCVCLVCGPGSTNAKRGVERLLRDWKLDLIISAGFSGALVEDLQIGDLIVGSSVISDETRKTFSCDSSDLLVNEQHDFLCMAAEIARTFEEKSFLHNRTKAVAVDLESYAVLESLAKAEISGLVLRSISDELKDEIPIEVTKLLDENGHPKLGTLFFSILKRPGFIFDLKRMLQKADKASRSLASGLVTMVKELN